MCATGSEQQTPATRGQRQRNPAPPDGDLKGGRAPELHPGPELSPFTRPVDPSQVHCVTMCVSECVRMCFCACVGGGYSEVPEAPTDTPDTSRLPRNQRSSPGPRRNLCACRRLSRLATRRRRNGFNREAGWRRSDG